MLGNIIVLPDGTELYSGASQYNNIRSVTITETINSGTELTLGSVCSAMLECKLQTPEGGLGIDTGTEVTLYKVDDTGARHKIGLFTAEKPTRPSAHSMSITAYDRVSWLDKDLTDWLAGLNGWPYDLLTFARMVCTECGLTLINEQVPNGWYMIHAFTGTGITGRKLMQWCGEICARFCRATADGEIEFATYQRNTAYRIGITSAEDVDAEISDDGYGNLTIQSEGIEVTDDGNGNVIVSGILEAEGDGNVAVTVSAGKCIGYFQGGLTYDDYQVAPIGRVQLRLTGDDVGICYPDSEDDLNTYVITGNYLLTASEAAALQPVAETIYGEICWITYTPCKVSIPVTLGIRAGDIVTITDRNGAAITACIMTKKQQGQRDTLECTGSASRGNPTAVNNTSMQAYNARLLEIAKSIEGLSVKAANIQTTVEDNQRVTEERIAAVTQTAESVTVSVQKIIDNGAEKVRTDRGYTFDDEGMKISKSGSEMTNLIDESGMYVTRGAGTSNETKMLIANADGVEATNLTARTYLTVGYSRFEAYSNGKDNKRTACFYIGG